MTLEELSELWRQRGYDPVLFNMSPEPPWVELYESRWGDPAPYVWEGPDAIEQAAQAAETMALVSHSVPHGPAVPVEVTIEWDMACHCYVVACLTYDVLSQGPPGGRPGAALESLETAMRLSVEHNGPLKTTTTPKTGLLFGWSADRRIWDMLWFPETRHLRFPDGRNWQSQRSVSR